MKVRQTISGVVTLAALLALLAGGMSQVDAQSEAQAASRYFPETNHTVTGAFLNYWNNSGGLVQQGYPITDEYPEVNSIDGKTYNTQYFQRARFEFHPELGDQNNQVLLGLLGVEAFTARYPDGNTGASPVVVPGTSSRFFAETSHTVTGLFIQYWNAHGGLAQQGYPISEAFVENSLTDGRPYVTQYFQRARFEYHPEISNASQQVLLGLVGVEIYQRKASGGGGGGGIPTPTQVAGGGCTIAPHQVFQYALAQNPDLAAKLGCPTTAGADYSNHVHGGWQRFKYAEMIVIQQDSGIAYSYALYSTNQTFKRVDYLGVSGKGGDAPLPGPHFYGAASQLNVGPATDDEDWGDGAYQNYQNGSLYYIGSQTQMVFAVFPAGATQGSWAKYKSRS